MVEAKQSDTDKIVSGINYALFGIPQDRTNDGMVGTMADIKATVENVKGNLNRMLATIIIGVAIDVFARAVIGA